MYRQIVILCLYILGGGALLYWLPKIDCSSLSYDIFALSEARNNSEADIDIKTCHSTSYTTELISLDPLIIYINDFLPAEEITELLALRSDFYYNLTARYLWSD